MGLRFFGSELTQGNPFSSDYTRLGLLRRKYKPILPIATTTKTAPRIITIFFYFLFIINLNLLYAKLLGLRFI